LSQQHAKMQKVKTAVLISGRGSNMTALVDAAKQDANFPADMVLVISNRPNAGGLESAREREIEALSIDHTQYETREAFEDDLQEALSQRGIELVVCAGFMRKLTATFTRKWEGAMINIHPSLLPKYKGLHTHQRALDAGDKEHGCTVHYVTAELDSGPIIMQAKVPVLEGDTADDLAARILVEEHRIFPLSLAIAARAIAEKSG